MHKQFFPLVCTLIVFIHLNNLQYIHDNYNNNDEVNKGGNLWPSNKPRSTFVNTFKNKE